jgi:1,4-alpha-glucan branching enzyme
MSAPSYGYLCLVLHAHLPFVRHPEHRTFLEEDWLFEAITECYAPLLDRLHRLADEGVPYRLTISISPPLAAMLQDPMLRRRYEARRDNLLRLAEQERERTRETPFAAAAAAMHEVLLTSRRVWDRWGGDLTNGFRRLLELGRVDLVTSTATHGYLPLMATREARRAQIHMGVVSHERVFGRPPAGMWLAECGFERDVDTLLADEGIAYFFTEAHAVLYAHPRPRFSVFAPVATAGGPTAFARDPECGRQVWSATEGYPGDFVYREYYRDLGFDADYDTIRPFLHPDGVRRHLGFKYYKITGRHVALHHKQPYEPSVAAGRAAEHAAHFVDTQRRRVEQIREVIGQAPVLTAPYDAELFGHWWFEGPAFLEAVIREAARDPASLCLATPADLLGAGTYVDTVDVNPSSWGVEGSSRVWLNGSNAWMYRHLHRMERRMVNLAMAHPVVDDRSRRLLNQAVRELFLAQSSDWPFIVTNRTSVTYALRRFQSHVDRFRRLDDMLSGRVHVDEGWLAEIEGRDTIFSDVDYRIFLRL